jgi:hypothetical protein
MKHNIVMEMQDLIYLKWSHIRSSSGTAGTFLKSESDRGIIFEGLETLLSDVFMDKIWNMIYERYQVYENL